LLEGFKQGLAARVADLHNYVREGRGQVADAEWEAIDRLGLEADAARVAAGLARGRTGTVDRQVESATKSNGTVNSIKVPGQDAAGTPSGAAKAGDRSDSQGPAVSPLRKPILDKTGYEIPKSVKAHYVAVEGKFVDRKSETIHFEDSGKKLSTASEDRKVISHMVEVAKAKNWGTLELKGTEAFRREAWIAAEVSGLETHGYKPNAQDRAAVESRRSEMRVSGGERAQESETKLVTKPENSIAPDPTTTAQAQAQAQANHKDGPPLSPQEMQELQADLAKWRVDRDKDRIAEIVTKHQSPEQRREYAKELLSAVGRDPKEFFPEGPEAAPADQKDKLAGSTAEPSTREAALRATLEQEMTDLGVPEELRTEFRSNLDAVLANARSTGQDLAIPEPLTAVQAISAQRESAAAITPAVGIPTVEVER
jgi:hypothetical protein